MNQQNQGSGLPSNVPVKRKRGRPRKEESVVRGQNMPEMHKSDNVLNSNQTVGTTDDCDDDMVGKVVTGVIEGTFKAGYLLNVKVADTDTFLRGLVFLPGQVNPVTAENDVAPHVKMIERKEFPAPILNPQTKVHGSVPSSVQCSKQSSEPGIQVPVSEEQVLPTVIHSGISVSLENQPAPTLIPTADLPKNETSICRGGIQPGIPGPEHASQSASMECDETVKQGATLHELDASTQIKESTADGGATKDSSPAPEPTDLVPTIENTDKELGTGQQVLPPVHQLNEGVHDENADKELGTGHQALPSVHQLHEVVHDEPNSSNIELNQIPVSAEPESMPSEQTSKSVDNFVEKQALPKTDLLEDTKTQLAIETLSKVDTSNTNGNPSTGTGNVLDVGSNHALETGQPESMPSEQIGQSDPSESKFSSEGCDVPEKSDPQNCSSLEVNKVDFNQPMESLANAVHSENQIGPDTS